MAADNDIDAQVIANLRELQRRQAVRPDPPPLRIHHLMACAAVAAVQLSLWRAAFPQALDQLTYGNVAVVTIYLVLASIGLTCALFSIYWHYKGFAGLVQPGQWLLLSYAISALNMYLQFVFVYIFASSWQNALRTVDPTGALAIIIPIISVCVYYVVPVVFFVWCAWKVGDTLAWRFVFVVLAIVHALPIGLIFSFLRVNSGIAIPAALGTYYLGRGIFLLLTETWAVATDRMQHRTRYWTHWVGLVLSMIGAVAQCVMGVLQLLN